MVSIAVVGIGNWGQNLVRNLVETRNVVLCYHDGATDNEEWLRMNYPGIDAGIVRSTSRKTESTTIARLTASSSGNPSGASTQTATVATSPQSAIPPNPQ